ncbi:hypothetical protein GOV11_00180 [Candidatus Woesearchaeota archaeon]|nr:hypothetical protein [Candidatus Woesearchaeota archaeon]
MNRRGDWIQIFLILFFVLLCMIAFLMLMIEKDAFEPVSSNLVQDLRDQNGETMLLGLLRQPFSDVDIDGDGRPDTATLADALAMNKDERYSDEIKKHIEKYLGQKGVNEYNIWIDYPAGYEDTKWTSSQDELPIKLNWDIIKGQEIDRDGYLLPVIRVITPGQGGNINIILYIESHEELIHIHKGEKPRVAR